MKTIRKEFKFSFVNDKNNYDEIKEVYCDSKSLFNKFMLLLTIIFAITVGYFIGKIFYFDFVDNRSYNLIDIISVLGVLLLIVSPAIYYILKIINFRFGKNFSYSLTEILKAEFFTSIGEGTVYSIIIKFADKRKVKISSTDRNFRILKGFLISKNMLVR